MLDEINLQMFSDDEIAREVIIDENNQESTSQENYSNSNDGQESTYEGQKEDVLVEEKVPLSVFLEEKRKRKELEKETRKYREDNTRSEIKAKWISKGYDEDFANEQSSIEYGLKELQETLNNTKLDNEILELSNEDAFFKDAVTYKAEIKQKMKEKNVTAEEAYLLLRGKTRRLELTEDIEQKNLLNRREASQAKNVIPNASSSKPTNPYPLDDSDKKALAELKKFQPNAGWDDAKYYKIMKS